MKAIKVNHFPDDIDLDEMISLGDDDNEHDKKKKKKHKKNKKDLKSNKKNKKKKSKKNKKKKKDKKKNKVYKYKRKGGFMGLLGEAVNVDVKSKVNVDVTDKSIDSFLQIGADIVKCLLSRGKEK